MPDPIDVANAESDDHPSRRLSAVISDLLAEPAYRAGLARADLLAGFILALRQVCGPYADGCQAESIGDGRVLLRVPNSTALQFVALNQRSVLGQMRENGLNHQIETIELRLTVATAGEGERRW